MVVRFDIVSVVRRTDSNAEVCMTEQASEKHSTPNDQAEVRSYIVVPFIHWYDECIIYPVSPHILKRPGGECVV